MNAGGDILKSGNIWQPVCCRYCVLFNLLSGPPVYMMYQNNWSGLEVDYINKYGEETYKY